MTHANLPFYFASFLLDFGGSLLLTVAHVVVLFEAWRRGLTAFLRWLVPSTLASIVFLVACFPSIGTRLGFRALSALFLYGLGLHALATALAVVAVFQLWRLVQGWPVGAGAGADHPPGGQAAGRQHEDVWPPPPTGPA